MRGLIALAITAITLVLAGLELASALHSWKWFFAALFIELILLCLAAAPSRKRDVTPQELAEELERHLAGSEGPYDWGDTTSISPADERLNRLIPRLIEYDRLDTPEKREQLRGIIEALRRGDIPG